MNQIQDPFDEMLSDHFRGELRPKAGRAGACFLAAVSPPAHPLEYQRVRPARRRVTQAIGFAMAAAALVAVVLGAGIFNMRRTTSISSPPLMPPARVAAASPFVPVEQVTESRTVDEGTVVFNDAPVRQVRRQVRQTMQWYDPQQNANIEITVPREQVVYVGLQPY